MDPVTHGIAGALLGKGFFSKRQEKVAIFAASIRKLLAECKPSYSKFHFRIRVRCESCDPPCRSWPALGFHLPSDRPEFARRSP
jgi:hypothetical protein